MNMKIQLSLNLILYMVVFTTSMTLMRKDDVEVQVENSPILPHYDDNEWVYQNCIKKGKLPNNILIKR
jgi:hypothetical protein